MHDIASRPLIEQAIARTEHEAQRLKRVIDNRSPRSTTPFYGPQGMHVRLSEMLEFEKSILERLRGLLISQGAA